MCIDLQRNKKKGILKKIYLNCSAHIIDTTFTPI